MFFDVIGWMGMIMVLVAYLLLSFGKLQNGYLYQFLNLMASLLMAIGLYPKNAWFSFALQVAWGVIAIISIVRFARDSEKPKRTNKSAKKSKKVAKRY